MDLSPPLVSTKEPEYRILKDGAAIFHDGRGVITLTGAESIDFLQRLSTNDVSPLREGQVVRTVLTSEKGRVVDLLSVIPSGGQLICVASQGRVHAVKAWLEKFIIMEDIQVADVNSSFETFCIVGSQAQSTLTSLFGITPDRPFPRPVPLGSDAVTFFEQKGGTGSIQCGFAPLGLISSDRTREHGISTLPQVGSEAFETFRIEEAILSPLHDAGERENPLESPLRQFISFSKGCYIGQEVIARIDTYKKLQKRIHAMMIEAPETFQPRSGVVMAGDEEVGYTTSHAWSYDLRRHLALGYLDIGAEEFPLSFRSPGATESFPLHLTGDPSC